MSEPLALTTSAMVFRLISDLDQFGFLTRPTLMAFDGMLPFDSMPLYAVIHELCYVRGYAAAPKRSPACADSELKCWIQLVRRSCILKASRVPERRPR